MQRCVPDCLPRGKSAVFFFTYLDVVTIPLQLRGGLSFPASVSSNCIRKPFCLKFASIKLTASKSILVTHVLYVNRENLIY